MEFGMPTKSTPFNFVLLKTTFFVANVTSKVSVISVWPKVSIHNVMVKPVDSPVDPLNASEAHGKHAEPFQCPRLKLTKQ